MGRTMAGWLGIMSLFVGCKANPSTVDSGSGPIGACGEVGEIASIEVSGRVRDEAGSWVADVDVALEERNWEPGIHGTGRTDATGRYAFTATRLPVVEDCWGTAVQYWLTGAKAGLEGDQPMNPYLIEAWEQGLSAIDTGDVPLILRGP